MEGCVSQTQIVNINVVIHENVPPCHREKNTGIFTHEYTLARICIKWEHTASSFLSLPSFCRTEFFFVCSCHVFPWSVEVTQLTVLCSPSRSRTFIQITLFSIGSITLSWPFVSLRPLGISASGLRTHSSDEEGIRVCVYIPVDQGTQLQRNMPDQCRTCRASQLIAIKNVKQETQYNRKQQCVNTRKCVCPCHLYVCGCFF